MKKIIVGGAVLVVGAIVVFSLMRTAPGKASREQEVFKETDLLSRQYVALRYRTDRVLTEAEGFSGYDAWNAELYDIISGWEALRRDASDLEHAAGAMADGRLSLGLVPVASAYDRQEISDVFDKAPAGKKIKTLAGFLGVDAKKAFEILKQDQAQVEADAWNEAGDTFQKLETSAVVIKDACKVTGMVGGIVLTGGTAAIASAGTAAQATVIVTGADLVLEVSSDAARIGLGNTNGISAIADSARTVTEPIATILTITNISGKVASGADAFDAVMVGLDQFNGAVQEGKIVGVRLPAYDPGIANRPVRVSTLKPEEITTWLEEQGIDNGSETAASVEAILGDVRPEGLVEKGTKEGVAESESETNDGTITGIWSGVMTFTPSQTADEQVVDFTVNLKEDGTVELLSEGEGFRTWSREGGAVRLFATSDAREGYYEFALSGDRLTFVKTAGPNSEGEWQEDFAGEDFFGGKYMRIGLTRQ